MVTQKNVIVCRFVMLMMGKFLNLVLHDDLILKLTAINPKAYLKVTKKVFLNKMNTHNFM